MSTQQLSDESQSATEFNAASLVQSIKQMVKMWRYIIIFRSKLVDYDYLKSTVNVSSKKLQPFFTS